MAIGAFLLPCVDSPLSAGFSAPRCPLATRASQSYLLTYCRSHSAPLKAAPGVLASIINARKGSNSRGFESAFCWPKEDRGDLRDARLRSHAPPWPGASRAVPWAVCRPLRWALRPAGTRPAACVRPLPTCLAASQKARAGSAWHLSVSTVRGWTCQAPASVLVTAFPHLY